MIDKSEHRVSTYDKTVFGFCLATSLFLLFAYLNNFVFKLNYILIGVFHEMLMIPCLLSQPILLFLALRGFYLSGFRIATLSFVSVVIVSISMFTAWRSFLFP